MAKVNNIFPPIMKTIKIDAYYLIILTFFTISCQQHIPFETISEGHIVKAEGFSQGTAWGDFDNDGFEDLFVTNSWTNGNNFLYKNNGDGTFTHQDKAAPANDGGNSNGCCWGDIDNDGDLDLFVANVNDQNNFLYRNNGDGTFEKVTTGDAVNDKGWSYTCSFADYNRDGWLDLFVGNYKDQANFLYTNDGQGNFIRTHISPFDTDKGSTQGSSWVDSNNDGWPDLIVVNYHKNFMYRNNGDGTFTRVNNAITKEDNNSFGCSSADFNNDGLTDLFIANWQGKNQLFQNTGNFEYLKITSGEIVNERLDSEGSSWGDVNNDGYLDLFVTNDGNNSFFLNDGDDSFSKDETISPVNDNANSNGVTLNDFDNDGDLDLFIANGGNQPNLLYRNQQNSGNWLKVKCTGTTSNKSAIGAKIILYHNKKTQYREISAQTGGGYGAQNGLIAHFGIPKNQTKVDSLMILWPSGKKSIKKQIDINTIIHIFESN
ncbi:CRTAC1 family protein [Prolixibacteraceae bacterium JC049]|nr:CRTAC1 family protein [Prolixibacteraceae bacterium JC049]